jgi:DNA repair protein RadC
MGPEKQELEAFTLETERKRVKKEELLKVARRMKGEGITDDVIKKVTGLSLKVIGGL